MAELSEALSPEVSVAVRKLRRLLNTPGQVSLGDWRGERYITDRFVVIKVTGNAVIEGKPDGAYRVVERRGLVANGTGAIDVNKFVTAIERGAQWLPATATGWSLTESEAKAMLVSVRAPSGTRLPMLINEDRWREFREQYGESIEFDADHLRIVHPLFRVRQGATILAYVAGVELQESETHHARMLVQEARLS